MRGVHLVLDELDDGNDEVGGVVPVEIEVDGAAVVLLDAVVHLLAECREEYDRAVGLQAFGLLGKLPDLVAAGAVDDGYEVKAFAQMHFHERFVRGLSPYDSRRVAQVKLGILLCYLHVYSSVFLQGKAVVVVAH